MFPLRTSQVHHHVQRSYLRRLSAGELRVKVQRVTHYFSGETLPVPTDEVNNAWNDLPNATADALKLPVSLKAKIAFPRAPPPTPTGLTFVIGSSDHPLDEAATNERHRVDDLYDMDSPTPDVVAFQALPGFSEEPDAMYPSSDQLDQGLSCLQGELDWSDNSTVPSEHGSVPISRQESPAPTDFHDAINRWISEYRAQGTESFIDSLIESAAESPESVSRMCRISHAVIRKVNKMSNLEGKALENAIRFSTLAVFKTGDICRMEPGLRSRLPRQTLSRSPCVASTSLASWVACSTPEYRPQRISNFACRCYWKGTNT